MSGRTVAGVTLVGYIVLILPFLTGLLSVRTTGIAAVALGIGGWVASRFTRPTDGSDVGVHERWERGRGWERMEHDLTYGNMRSHHGSAAGSASVRKGRR